MKTDPKQEKQTDKEKSQVPKLDHTRPEWA